MVLTRRGGLGKAHVPITDMLRELSRQFLGDHRVMCDEESVAADFSQMRECGIGDSDSIIGASSATESTISCCSYEEACRLTRLV